MSCHIWIYTVCKVNYLFDALSVRLTLLHSERPKLQEGQLPISGESM